MKKIILIVGASGVGKDTLLRNIKNQVEANFIKRYITRVPSKDEENYYVDKEAFEILDDENYFISTWKAHDNKYGIAGTLLKKGLNIISISRGAIKDFEDQYDAVTTINIIDASDLIEFDNSKPIEKSSQDFINLIESINNEK